MDNSTNGCSSPPPPIDDEPSPSYIKNLLKFISDVLMEEEEELGNNPYMLHDGLALQATEKSLHEALHNINLDTTLHHSPSSSGVKKISEMLMEEEEELGNNPYMLHDVLALKATEKSLHDALHNINLDTTLDHSLSSSGVKKISEMLMEEEEELGNNMVHDVLALQATEKSLHDALHNTSPGVNNKKKIINYPPSREHGDPSEHHMMRSHKQSANNNDDDESEPLEIYDDVLLFPDSLDQTCGQTNRNKKKSSHRKEKSKRGPKPKIIGGGNEYGGGGDEKKFIDLRSLLIQCAQALAKVDNKTANDLLWEIRQHSSPVGDGMERLAHYFANALDARLAFTGTDLYAPLDSKERISAAEVLKSYRLFVIACPFRHFSNILANAAIFYLATSATTTIHVVDFGILYGFQWPCLIQVLSQRPSGPPKLRITGIDFPQPGFRPAERVAVTGRRLAKYCERFGVPFEYNAIAQKWDTIKVEDLKIQKTELVVVNCMYRLHNVPDEIVSKKIPRDELLSLIKEINPEMFIHGVAHGTYNAPFFVPRFKEALFHFSAMFDMFDATMPKDDENRLLYEKQFFGKEVMNIIACEGTERVERTETYKQWQRKTVRAGFRQVPIDQEVLKTLRKVKRDYHKCFTVEEDGEWVLLGWKGRVIQGFSCWRPIHN